MAKRKIHSNYSEFTEIGKMPPQSIDYEEIVLGALLLEKNAIYHVADILKAECFYKEGHQKIYNAITDLFNKNKPIDLITVSDQLRINKELDEIGGIAYITMLSTRVSSSAHIEYHAKRIREKFIAREFIRISSEVQNRAYDEYIDINDLSEYMQSEIYKTINIDVSVSEKLSEINKRRLDEISKLQTSDNKFTGVPSGFSKLDRITSGFQSTDLIIVGGRPSMGKTTVVFKFALNCCEMGYTVDMYSLEMSKKQLDDKALSMLSSIENSFIRTGQIDEQQWEMIEVATSKIEKLNLYIDDQPGLKIFDFKARARRNKMKFNTDLIIIDYLQLMSAPEAYKRGGREQEIAEISKQLKQTAKELNVPVIALSQMNRSVDSRSGYKRPQLSDLRESGAIEQDADMVIFINRPEYYGITEDHDGNNTKNLIELILAKHRNGVTGDLNIYKNNNWTDIKDISEDYTLPDPTSNEKEETPF